MKIKNSESIVFCGTTIFNDSTEEFSNYTQLGIKLFKIKLSKYYDIVDVLFKVLIPAEADRAQRYRHIKDRNRFIISRSLLRFLLAKETNSDISEIHFEKHDNHKPYLILDKSIFFNVSHAGDYAVIAIGDCELGVDIEFIDSSFDFSEIVSNVFKDIEIKFIRGSDNEKYAFYKLWTRKEAIVKAIGKGIDDNFIRIPATEGLHTVSTLLINNFKNINVFSFDLNNEYIGALALTKRIYKTKNINFYHIPTAKELLYIFNYLGNSERNC